jgi:carbonic anhydrase
MASVRNLVISCIDFRFRKKVAEWIETKLDDEADLVAIAGAKKPFLAPESREFLMDQVAIAKRLHSIETVHIIAHEDCGAYGGSKAFPSLEAERDSHTKKMQEAHALIHEKFPDLHLKGYFLRFANIEEIHSTSPRPHADA